MRLVVAVGGNALLERGEMPLAEIQEKHVRVAVDALAPLAVDHDLVVTHGNGPQVGLLANESAADPALPHPYPLDVLGAQTQGMIGYFLLQGFENALPGRQVVSLICQTQVASDDPAFEHPTKFVGPQYSAAEGHRLAGPRGWQIRRDGADLAPGGRLPRTVGHRRTPHHQDPGRLRRHRHLLPAVEASQSPAARTESSAAWRRSSTRTSPPPFSPGISTPTPC